jgi:hypothetical protein
LRKENFSISHLLHQLHLVKLTSKNGRKYLIFLRLIYTGFWRCLITSTNIFFLLHQSSTCFTQHIQYFLS